jgi:DNA polymerase III subunit gamma/tau
MSDYQVIARKFRPQSFQDVVGQEAIVTTLKNGIKNKRLAQAYLFCGSRGTGKTTLARLFAKALNCQQLTETGEPCNQCSSCLEITSGCSLDVLEIDGASHRGIEDIRQINETVGYAAASGHYKIYIIDEVHMLTKEAFNALLKTLEEPPPKVKFFFATTEPHKVLPTILSRCQRFNLSRISLSHIIIKLRYIAHQLGVEIEEEALQLLAQRAEGGLRDAESLLDQMIAFEGKQITAASLYAILGMMPRTVYFKIDQAGHVGDFKQAFEIAYQMFHEGKDLTHFIEGLIDHIRQILLFKLTGPQSALLQISPADQALYAQSAHWYSQEQCLDLMDYLLEAQQKLRFAAFGKTALEAILLHVMRSHFRLPIEQLVYRLIDLEQKIQQAPQASPLLISEPEPVKPVIKTTLPPVIEAPMPVAKTILPVSAPRMKTTLFEQSMSEDPTPTLSDLGKPSVKVLVPKVAAASPISSEKTEAAKRALHEYDTLFQFASVELEGRLQKNV